MSQHLSLLKVPSFQGVYTISKTYCQKVYLGIINISNILQFPNLALEENIGNMAEREHEENVTSIDRNKTWETEEMNTEQAGSEDLRKAHYIRKRSHLKF